MSTTTWLDLPALPLTRRWTMSTTAAIPATEMQDHAREQTLTIYPDGVVDIITSADALGRSIAESFPLAA